MDTRDYCWAVNVACKPGFVKQKMSADFRELSQSISGSLGSMGLTFSRKIDSITMVWGSEQWKWA